MGVKDILLKLQNSDSRKADAKVPPAVPWHSRPPTSTPSAGNASVEQSAQKLPPADRPFVVVRDGQLQLDNGVPFRFASMNAPELLECHEFEVEDTMRTLTGFGRRVTRTYTLRIKGTSRYVGDAVHIEGWDAQKQDWIYSESQFRKMDHVLAVAAKYDVRLVIPLINQDFGSANDNWAGNWVDIVIHVKNPRWTYQDAKQRVDFFTDQECIAATKKMMAYVLNRRNTITGVRYGDDPCVLAWETGNELQYNWKGKLPAPGAWTVDIARHLKSLAPRTLVMDGSFAKCDGIEKAYATDVLKSPHVELLSYHYYGNGDTHRIQKDVNLSRKYGKVFVAGEYGFLDSVNDYALFLGNADRTGCGGSMVWSLRPHSHRGGFMTHREDEVNCAYHAPGWPNPTSPPSATLQDWDTKEHAVVNYIRHASFAINHEATPEVFPQPNAPHAWAHDGGLSWRGSSWANSYEIWAASHDSPDPSHWRCITQGLNDAVNAGQTWFGIPDDVYGKVVKMRGVTMTGMPGDFSAVVQL